MTVKYENYKQFRSLSDIQYEGVVGEKKEAEKKEAEKKELEKKEQPKK